MINSTIRNPHGPSPKESRYYHLVVQGEYDDQMEYLQMHGLAEPTKPTQEEIRTATKRLLRLREAELTDPAVIIYLDWLTHEQSHAVSRLLMDPDTHGDITPEQIIEVSRVENLYQG